MCPARRRSCLLKQESAVGRGPAERQDRTTPRSASVPKASAARRYRRRRSTTSTARGRDSDDTCRCITVPFVEIVTYFFEAGAQHRPTRASCKVGIEALRHGRGGPQAQPSQTHAAPPTLTTRTLPLCMPRAPNRRTAMHTCSAVARCSREAQGATRAAGAGKATRQHQPPMSLPVLADAALPRTVAVGGSTRIHKQRR